LRRCHKSHTRWQTPRSESVHPVRTFRCTEHSDEAEWHFWNSHEKDLSEEVWGEIFALSDKNRKLFIPFAMNLVNNLGWSVKQVNAFSFNEQGMLDYYRWGRSTTRAAKLPWGMKRVH
jgi:hypothetical protein